MKVEVKFGSRTVEVTVSDDPGVTLATLKHAIAALTGVPAPMQKLMGKYNVKDDSKTLIEIGIRQGAKLMLVGSSAKEVMETNTASKAKEAERVQRIKRNFGDSFWLVPPFGGVLCDAFAAGKGNPAEGSAAETALMCLDAILTRLNPAGEHGGVLMAVGMEAAADVSHRFLPDISASARVAICTAHRVVRKCADLCATLAKVQSAEAVPDAVDEVVTAIRAVAQREWVMIPAGWIGQQQHNVVYLLITRSGGSCDSVFSVVVVNRRLGAQTYHSQLPVADKIKSQATLRFDGVPESRLLDHGFWLVCLSLWLRANDPQNVSEYCRMEVFYDALLPWLCERATAPTSGAAAPSASSAPALRDVTESAHRLSIARLPDLALSEERQSDELSALEASLMHTNARSESSAVKGAITAFTFVVQDALLSSTTSAGSAARSGVNMGHHMSVREVHVLAKRLRLVLKYEMFVRAAEDLVLTAQRHLEAEQTRRNAALLPASTARPAAPAAARRHDVLKPGPSELRMQAAVERAVAVGIDPRHSAPRLSQLFDTLTTRDFLKTKANTILTNPAAYCANRFVLVYFSASWCAPCKKVAPLLTDLYDKLVQRLPRMPDGTTSSVECILVSADKSVEEFDAYAAKFPFLRLSWPGCTAALEAYHVQAIPTLFVFSPSGMLQTSKGVEALRKDPEGLEFPTGLWAGVEPMSDTDVSMLQLGAQVLAHATVKRAVVAPHVEVAGNAPLEPRHAEHIHDVISATLGVLNALPWESPKPAAEGDDGRRQCALSSSPDSNADVGGADLDALVPSKAVTLCGLPNAELLPRVSKAQYYGGAFKPSIPELDDLSSFVVPTTLAEMLVVIANARKFVERLWDRAKHSGTSSRVAVQMHIIEFVSWLFTNIVPVPSAAAAVVGPRGELNLSRSSPAQRSALLATVVSEQDHHPSNNNRFTTTFGSAMYLEAFPDSAAAGSDAQLQALKQIYFLTLSYCTAWQAVETPARSYDSERCLVAATMLVVYDALARNTSNSKAHAIMSRLLTDDGGYFPSTTMCKSNRSFEDISSALELVKPRSTCVRHAVLEYLAAQKRLLRRELFDLRQTDKLELRKHSYTVDFMRKFLERCGYEIFPREPPAGSAMMPMSMNQSEMEKLMTWFCDARTPLAKEHPEFSMLRDMVLLTKFLGTMELRDAQLARKKKELDEFASWRLSFEEDNPGRQMSAGWRTRPEPPRWDCLMVRGRDMDIADIAVRGFGDRELLYGEGLVVQSPIDVGARLNLEAPTEDDLLHTPSLPTFGDTLTVEESEVLLSILTTPYLRIPLLLNFFSSHDRHSYLFCAELQLLLRAAVFEPGVYYRDADRVGDTAVPSGRGDEASAAQSNEHHSPKVRPSDVPLRLTRAQKTEVQLAVIRGDTTKQDYSHVLGSRYGLLLLELQHSPMAVFAPLQRLLRTIHDLGPSSVYSLNCAYVLFLCGFATDVVTYAVFALTMFARRVSEEAEGGNAVYGCLSSDTAALVEEGVDSVLLLLQTTVRPLIQEWAKEADANDDTPTQCVLETYAASVSKVLLEFTQWWESSCACASAAAAAAPLLPSLSSSKQQAEDGDTHLSAEGSAQQPHRHGRRSLGAIVSDADALLTSVLTSCTFVRARHGFGMGTQRTQLAATATDELLTPEEKLLRFLQAQGLDTKRVTKEMLEHGRRLMNSGGRRRAVFVQIRSRFYNDTVRIPNLFRADGSSAEASKRLKLPPVDVPEHLVFAMLLELHSSVRVFLETAAATAVTATSTRLDSVMNSIVGRVLRDATHQPEEGSGGSGGGGRTSSNADAPAASTTRHWVMNSGAPASTPSRRGLLSVSSPASGLVFHVITCELFWRQDELKPVPDSMSHFTDYEAILGKDILQCGLVKRTEHCHWVHVVGTPYDLLEWSEPDPDDRGLHQPRILVGPPVSDFVEQVRFEGRLYDRPLDIYDETPWPVVCERWAVELLREVLKEAYPMPSEMKYRPVAMSVADCDDKFIAATPLAEDEAAKSRHRTECSVLRFLMNDKTQYEDEEGRNTWKEVIVTKDPLCLHLYNLVPHARCMYRSLVYSSSQRLSLSNLALLKKPRSRRTLDTLQFQAGELKRRVFNETSLEVWRYQIAIRGREVYVPARLLQGVVPSALLESFLFWHGEDDVLRGYPMADSDDGVVGDEAAVVEGKSSATSAASRSATLQHWFNYTLEGTFVDGTCRMVRRNDKQFSTVAQTRRSRANAAASSVGRIHSVSAVCDGDMLMRRTTSFDGSATEGSTTSVPQAAAAVSEIGAVVGAQSDDEQQQRLAAQQGTTTMGDGRAGSFAAVGEAGDEGDDGIPVPASTMAILQQLFPGHPVAVLLTALRESHHNVAAALEWLANPENEIAIAAIQANTSSLPSKRRSLSSHDDRGSPGSPLEGSSRRDRQPSYGSLSDCPGGEGSTTSPLRHRQSSVATTGGTGTVTVVKEGEDDDNTAAKSAEPLTLLHLHMVPIAHPLRPLVDRLLTVEDASHILLWGAERRSRDGSSSNSNIGGRRGDRGGNATAFAEDSAVSNDDVDGFVLCLVELPRLRAKFQPRPTLPVSSSSSLSTSTSSVTRLFLLDNPGWLLADPPEYASIQSALQTLAAPFPQHLVLRNLQEDYCLMVPNHDFCRLVIRGDPFSRRLLFDRGSMQWQESVPSPWYLYQVHPSRAFLVPPSLAASLYLGVLQCMAGAYEAAMRSLEACYVDTAFTVEERFMCALMERTLDPGAPDLFPDAHAVRLKLAHAVMHSPNTLGWPLAAEVEGYLSKIRHVSANCRLQREEVLDLLKRCAKAPLLVRCQLELWVPFLQQRRSVNPVRVHAHTQRWGQPWDKLLTTNVELLSKSNIDRIQYQAPNTPIVGKNAVNLLWDDELLTDEVSGASRRLGFFFLYEAHRKRIPIRLRDGDENAPDISGSLAEILTRYFHLRHARWGMEFQSEGEGELQPSFPFAVLGAMEAFPDASWPDLTDRATLAAMERGAPTAMPSGASTMLDESDGLGRRPAASKLPQFVRALESLMRNLHRTSMTHLVRYRRELQQAHRARQDRPQMVAMRDYIVPRCLPHNTACDCVTMRSGDGGGGGGPSAKPTTAPSTQSPPPAPQDDELRILGSAPLSELPDDGVDASGTRGFYSPLCSRERASTTSAELPFAIADHSWASTHVAKDMLLRTAQDLAQYASMMNRSSQSFLRCLTAERLDCFASSSVASQQEQLDILGEVLRELHRLERSLSLRIATDRADVDATTAVILRLANDIEVGDDMHRIGLSAAPSSVTRPLSPLLLFRLRRLSKDREPQSVEWLCGALLSTTMEEDIAENNPFHGSLSELRSRLVRWMLITNRSAFATQAVAATRLLSSYLREVLHPFVAHHHTVDLRDGATVDVLKQYAVEWNVSATEHDLSNVHLCSREVESGIRERLKQLAAAVVELLSAGRFYATIIQHDEKGETEVVNPVGGAVSESARRTTCTTMQLDPRFLLFEFLFSILLRKRQVEMVRWFVDNTQRGISRVQQMLMGQGKTTVVGPLLALILGNGERLVMQVMPTALLEQSRTVLRRCFSVVIPKRILSLEFDRSFPDDPDAAEALFQKLDAARRMRAVVVAAPECVKALYLKFVEALHVIETVTNEDLDATSNGASGDERVRREVQLLRNRTISRSKTADALVPIMQLWRDGVLLMDEVDVLLHPLRSELNFPLGIKDPIELSGPRWFFPMHLLSGLFPLPQGGYPSSRRIPLGGTAELLHGLRPFAAGSNRSRTCSTANDPEAGLWGQRLARLHEELQATIAIGVERKALQREPHLVLLDEDFYVAHLLDLLMKWSLLWLEIVFRDDERDRGCRLDATASSSAAAATRDAEEEEDGDPAVGALWRRMAPGGALHGLLLTFLRAGSYELMDLQSVMHSTFSRPHMQLLFLVRDWLGTILPHVFAKIDRVGYGLLQPGDLAAASGEGTGAESSMPLSRKLMGVPFVAKDVPSRSSEFAHPDVVLGLTILAYRYEGLRLSDTKSLLLQLKQDHSREAGPKSKRPSSVLYQSWLTAAASSAAAVPPIHWSDRSEKSEAIASPESEAVVITTIPLSQIQVHDPLHLHALHAALKRVPAVVYYYLSHHVFPRTMNFQQLKVSACGHELGSSILFHRRIGFSGTPSNLLPLDLGECFYEPGSDGNILTALTNPAVTSVELLPDGWSPRELLRRIARANPPYHALIDTGALITNMSNASVASFLLNHLPAKLFEGVVYLDRSDRQVVLLRSNGLVVPVSQCGVALSRRFTFFDQVHTTGMDIKQTPTATAVVTLGKDLVFRDYAQGAYRMRGIGRGQRICVYVIPEVHRRMRDVLGPSRCTGRLEVDVPAWLMLNAMRVEGLQFMKLSQQELGNVWRKHAFAALTTREGRGAETDYERCRRFSPTPRPTFPFAADCYAATTVDQGISEVLLRHALEEYRESISFPVPHEIAEPKRIHEVLTAAMERKPRELLTVPVAVIGPSSETVGGPPAAEAAARERIDLVLRRLAHSNGGISTDTTPMRATDLSSEVVHEQEAEEEQEQEAEQEEQRVSAYSRDDEQHIPWKVSVLLPSVSSHARLLHQRAMPQGNEPACADETLSQPDATVNAAVVPAYPVGATGSPFYSVNRMGLRGSSAVLRVPPQFCVSDNFIRLKWRGVGERRIKNCVVYVEWHPNVSEDASAGSFSLPHPPLSDGGDGSGGAHGGPQRRSTVYAVVSLAEGESLRWYLRHSAKLGIHRGVSLRLRDVATGTPLDGVDEARDPQDRLSADDDGPFPDESAAGQRAATSTLPIMAASLLFRFLNNDMYYTEEELAVLQSLLSDTSLSDRLEVFLELLRGRRRQRNEWEDAPIAALFVANDGDARRMEARRTLSALRRYVCAVRKTVGSREWLRRVRSEMRCVPPAAAGCDATAAPTVTGEALSNSPPTLAVRSLREVGRALLRVLSQVKDRNLDGLRNTATEVSSSLSDASRRLRGIPRQLREADDLAHAVEVALIDSAFHGPVTSDPSSAEEAPRPPPPARRADVPLSFAALGAALPEVFEEDASLWSCERCQAMNPVVTASCWACRAVRRSLMARPDGGNSQRQPQDHESGGPSADPWSCPACTLFNLSSAANCAVCHTANPNPVRVAASEPLPWPCPVCTLVNAADASHCAACMNANPNPRPKTSSSSSGGGGAAVPWEWECPEGHWSCSVERGGCSKFNPNSAYYCQVCDRARPSLATLRF